MKEINLLVTHNSAFHADEVFAIALLRVAGCKAPIFRTRDVSFLEMFKKDAKTCVIDVGFSYNLENQNYDHHQDIMLRSSAGLIWDNFKFDICPDEFIHPYMDRFISAIDAVDTNRDDIYKTLSLLPAGFRNASNIISGFNRDHTDDDLQLIQFEKAVEFAVAILENELIMAVKWAVSEEEYNGRTILNNNIAVFSNYSSVWKEKGDHLFAIMPHASGWQIQSADTSLAVVPESVKYIDGFVFRHGSGFMATCTTLNSLITFAEKI